MEVVKDAVSEFVSACVFVCVCGFGCWMQGVAAGNCSVALTQTPACQSKVPFFLFSLFFQGSLEEFGSISLMMVNGAQWQYVGAAGV